MRESGFRLSGKTKSSAVGAPARCRERILLPWAILVTVAILGTGALGGNSSSNVEEYEICYHHVIWNKSEEPLDNVRVYLPVPQNDSYQTVVDYRLEFVGADYSHSHVSDKYGNQIKRVVISIVQPGERIEIGFSCVARFREQAELRLKKNRLPDEIPDEVSRSYLDDQKIFGLKSEIVQVRATSFLEENADPTERAIAIHDHLARDFRYVREGGWDSAPDVLERRSGSCSEFSYAFCALCRATGIPTRLAGGSIMPLEAELPMEDRVWHRWSEAYLPGYGWVPFDSALDRGRAGRGRFAGNHHPRVLILTRCGGRSDLLGLSYIGANTHGRSVGRERYFVWSLGTMDMLKKALDMLEKGKKRQAKVMLRRLVSEHAGTRAAEEARVRLVDMN